MKYMLCYAVTRNVSKVDTQYFETFEEAVMKYTVLCSNCYDVVLADTEEKKILRHYCFRNSATGCSVTNF